MRSKTAKINDATPQIPSTMRSTLIDAGPAAALVSWMAVRQRGRERRLSYRREKWQCEWNEDRCADRGDPDATARAPPSTEDSVDAGGGEPESAAQSAA